MPERLDDPSLRRARRALARRDPRLAAWMREVGPCRLPPPRDPYRSLVRGVVFQQLAGSAARTIEARLHAHFGGRLPAPARLAATPDATLRRLGLSRQKAATLRAVAEAFATGELCGRRIARMDDDAVVEAVTRVRGIGPWTAHMLLIFGLRRPDVLPVGDYGVRKGAAALYALPELPGARALEGIAEPWRPWRSVASWYLWRAAEGLARG